MAKGKSPSLASHWLVIVIDLLKGSHHNPTQKFIEDLSDIDLFPTITRPTHITNHSMTLIDNI